MELTARDAAVSAATAILANALALIHQTTPPDALPSISNAEERALRLCVAVLKADAARTAADNPAPVLQLGAVSTDDIRQMLLETPTVN